MQFSFCFSNAQIPDSARPISQNLHSCDVQWDPWEIRNKALIEKSEHRNQALSQSYSSCLHGLKATWPGVKGWESNHFGWRTGTGVRQPKASLGSLFPYFTCLPMRKFFLVSNANFPRHNEAISSITQQGNEWRGRCTNTLWYRENSRLTCEELVDDKKGSRHMQNFTGILRYT